jgi:formylglycine-generating enzyme required for sulfatase activity
MRWKLSREFERIDRELATVERTDQRFQWRISRERLTLVTVDDPALDHVFEVSDTEITVELFRRFKPGFQSDPRASPEDLCPVNSITFHDAAEFCNRLTLLEGYAPTAACYRKTPQGVSSYEEVSNHLNLPGFRLPTHQEFDSICSAGTTTRRYFGDSDALFHRYAWILLDSNGKAHPVATKLPNELGLFDTLGNIQEWCERPIARGATQSDSGDLRGGWFGWSPPSEVDRSSLVPHVPKDQTDPTMGFRVVRTKKHR